MLGLVKLFKLVIVVLLIGWLGLGLCPKPVLYPETKNSKALFDQHEKLLALSISTDEKYRLITSLDQVSKDLVSATLIYEDRYFYWHPGVNIFSLIRAALTSLFNSNRLVGGSTLTMQLARLNYNLYTRSISGKIKQIFYALLLERHYSKAQILEAYLNFAPYGANIEGIGAASLVYYRKRAKNLSASEALTLAVLPQHPSLRWRASGQKDLELARNELLSRWEKKFSDSELIPQDLQYSPTDIPFSSAHFLERVSVDANQSEFNSFIDSEIQVITEQVLTSSLKRYSEYGIKNGAIIVAELPDLKVRAYVGSAQYTNIGINGFVNGLKSARSPGSLLKPFVYGLALDQGVITPETMLKDLPIRLAAYNPENFERNFLGPLSATNALVKSRNIPALELYRQLAPSSFYNLLKNTGVKRLKPEDYYGIALVLGGLGVTAEEVTSLYGMLGNLGQYQGLKFIQEEQASNLVQTDSNNILSKEASFLVLDMLSKNPPALTRFKTHNIPWKTGTSYGSKDAWSAGIIGKYVVVVWLGNFNGQANPNLVGRDMAGPIFFNMLDRLQNAKLDFYFPQNNLLNIKQVEVCAASGQIPSSFCKHKKQSWFIPGVSPISTCKLHQQITINPDTGLRLCFGESGGIKKTYEVWDSDTQQLFTQIGLKRNLPPPFEARCENKANSDAEIRIVSPEEHIQYYVEPYKNLELELFAVLPGDATKLSWFIDNQLVAQVNPNQTFYWPAKAGKFIVRAVDNLGRSKIVNVQVNQQVG